MLVFWRWCFLRGGLPEKVEFIGRDDLIEVGRLFLDVLHVELFEKVNKILAKEPIGEKFLRGGV